MAPDEGAFSFKEKNRLYFDQRVALLLRFLCYSNFKSKIPV